MHVRHRRISNLVIQSRLIKKEKKENEKGKMKDGTKERKRTVLDPLL